MFPHNYYNNKQNRNKKSCALPFKKGKTKLRKNSPTLKTSYTQKSSQQTDAIT